MPKVNNSSASTASTAPATASATATASTTTVSNNGSVVQPINNKLALEVKTAQSSSIKILFEALKDILTDANLECDSTGLKIIALDTSHTALVHLKLIGKKFEHFYCEKKLILGINMINLYKVIKMMDNNDTLGFSVEQKDQNFLGLEIKNKDGSMDTKFKLALMDLDETTISVPPAHFDSIMTMPSAKFQKICKDMSEIAEVMEIKSIGSKVIFSCKGEIAERVTTISETNNQGMQFSQKQDEDKIVQGNFVLKTLVMFTKCTNLCSTIEMYLKNDYPLIIKYTVANLGDIRLCLAPQSSKKKNK